MRRLMTFDNPQFISPLHRRMYNDFERLLDSSTGQGHSYFEDVDGHYVSTIDMPGVRAEDIDISFENSVLSIKATRESDRGSRNYSFSMTAPSDLQEDGDFQAVYENGVLKIALPKAEKAKARKISLKSNDEDGFFSKLFGATPAKEVDVENKNH